MALLAADKESNATHKPPSEAAPTKGLPARLSAGSTLARLAGIRVGVWLVGLMAAFLCLGGWRVSFAARPNKGATQASVAVPTPSQLWKRIEALRKANAIMARSHPFQLAPARSTGTRSILPIGP